MNIVQTLKNHFLQYTSKNQRVVLFLGKEMTELQALRAEHGIRAGELAKELGISEAKYSGIESGKRKMSDDEYDKMYFDVNHAITRILSRRDEIILDINAKTIIYYPLDRKRMTEALLLLAKGKNAMQVANELGIDQKELYANMSYLSTISEDIQQIFETNCVPYFK